MPCELWLSTFWAVLAHQTVHARIASGGCLCGCLSGCGYGCGYGCVRENQLQADRGSIEGLAHKVRHECVLVFGGCGWGMGVCVRRCVHVGVCLRVAIPISNSNCEAEASAWVASFFYLR